MTAYNTSNSHDPKTDHRSLYTLIVICALGVVGILAAFGVLPGTGEMKSTVAQPFAVIDGCTVYRFEDEDGTNYFATCGNGKVSTTYANGTRHIITQGPKP